MTSRLPKSTENVAYQFVGSFAMATEFFGNDHVHHDAFQQWRRHNKNGFNLTEKSKTQYTMHWSQDKRESEIGRGCTHQGGSGNDYRADKGGCYTTARKVCSNDVGDLVAWATRMGVSIKHCSHCNTKRFPFPE